MSATISISTAIELQFDKLYTDIKEGFIYGYDQVLRDMQKED
jgi:hypothetical protein